MILHAPRSALFPTRRSSDLTLSSATSSARFGDLRRLTRLREASGLLANGLDEKMKQSQALLFSLIFGAVVTFHFYTHLFRSEEHTSELQSRRDLVCRLLLEQ